MNDLQTKLKAAKDRLNRAAERCADPNNEGAAFEADEALAEIAALQAMMKAERGRVCAASGCSTWTLRQYCGKHEPADVWAECRRTLNELHGRDDA